MLDPATVVTCDTSNDDTCSTTACVPTTGACEVTVHEGTTCDDGDPCTQETSCDNTGACVGVPLVCVSTDPCFAGSCDAQALPSTYDPGDPSSACVFAPVTVATACDDGDACTRVDSCNLTTGDCEGSDPVVCTALDQCHAVGTCDPGTGMCSTPDAPDNQPCDDGDLCTPTDTCQLGICTPGGSVTCTALDACHVPGTCNPDTGMCDNPEEAPGTACPSMAPCSEPTGYCIAGRCEPVEVACDEPPPPFCADSFLMVFDPIGACAPGPSPMCVYRQTSRFCPDGCANGQCTTTTCVEGEACEDGNPCTMNDTCSGGVCMPGAPRFCPPDGNPCTNTQCSPVNGLCENFPVPDGTSCDDNSMCSQVDRCFTGICQGNAITRCEASGVCMSASCDPMTGGCQETPIPNGTSCSDGDPCTGPDQCQSGACVGSISVDPREPNNTFETATALAQVDFCASIPGTMLSAPLKAEGDVDWYKYFVATRLALCDVEPWTRLHNAGTDPVEVCMYYACADASLAQVTCNNSTPNPTSPPTGSQGCCNTVAPGGTAAMKLSLNCSGGEAGTAYVRVQTGPQVACGFYDLWWSDD